MTPASLNKKHSKLETKNHPRVHESKQVSFLNFPMNSICQFFSTECPFYRWVTPDSFATLWVDSAKDHRGCWRFHHLPSLIPRVFPTFNNEIWRTMEVQVAKALAYHQLRVFGNPLGATKNNKSIPPKILREQKKTCQQQHPQKKTSPPTEHFSHLISQPWVLVNFAISYRFLSGKITRGVMKWWCAICQMPRSCHVSALDSRVL